MRTTHKVITVLFILITAGLMSWLLPSRYEMTTSLIDEFYNYRISPFYFFVPISFWAAIHETKKWKNENRKEHNIFQANTFSVIGYWAFAIFCLIFGLLEIFGYKFL